VSGFKIGANSFSFPNFTSGYPGSVVTPALMQRLFGNAACADTASPCGLTPMATGWLKQVNQSLSNGRCEGFAVASQLFFLGKLDPSSFGASSVAGLSLAGNDALQAEIAYWFATQFDSSVMQQITKSLDARETATFLLQNLQPGATEAYRLGMVQIIDGETTGGHAVTPIGILPGSASGTYDVHIYDNNFPNQDRVLTIDTNADTWEYDTAVNPGNPQSLYEGDPSNANPLYLAASTPRVGTLPCAFCQAGSSGATLNAGLNAAALNSGPVTATLAAASSDAGTPAGDAGAAAGAVVVPGFASGIEPWSQDPPRSLWISTPGPWTFTLSGRTLGSGTGAVVNLGPGFLGAASGLTIPVGSTPDALQVSADGSSVSYTNNSGTGLDLAIAIALGSGKYLQVDLTLPPGASLASISVDVATGAVSMATTTQAQVASDIAIALFNGGDGSNNAVFQAALPLGPGPTTATLQATSWSPPGPMTGSITINGTSQPLTLPNAATQCSDGIKDGNETAVDCGGNCPSGCVNGQGCLTDKDCASAVCDPVNNLCVATTCQDGIQDGSETGVDCGGTCTTKCATGDGCQSDSDCVSQACYVAENVCVASTCQDGFQDGNETGVDCGGSCPTECALGQGCKVDGDCASAICNTTLGECVSSTCQDGIKDGSETGVDCGGSCTDKCSVGQGCGGDSDCATGDCSCTGGPGACTGGTGTCGAGLQAFAANGTCTSQTFTVPASCSTVLVEAWGGGGGGGSDSQSVGGGGAFVSGTIAVSQGDAVSVYVGSGGGGYNGSVSAVGGNGCTASGAPASGGGGNTSGGGGGGGATSVALGTTTLTCGAGGGGSSGGPGDPGGPVGATGTGGASGASGGNGVSNPGGGGGGGLTGGTGQTSTQVAFGGSSTTSGGFTAVGGSGATPGGTSAFDYGAYCAANTGVGASGDGKTGGPGCVVIRCE
jgi:hypothetical protein